MADATAPESKRQEHTVTGAMIGAVRDAFGAPETAADRAKQAEQNDQWAKIAADVISCIPRLNILTAGTVRASMLIDPNASLGQNIGSFALNGAEGSLLNKVTRASMAEGALGQFTTAKLGSGLSGELGTHFVAGGAFGAVRTGFDANTWNDEHGNFSLSNGAKNFATGTLTGALINVPAGVLGSRAARLIGGNTDGITTRLLTGATSGSAAGGVFGFTDAYVRTGSFAEADKGMREGMIVGALSGTAGSAFPVRMHAAPVETANTRVTPSETAQPTTNAAKASAVVSETSVKPAVEAPPELPTIGDGRFTVPDLAEKINTFGSSLTFKSTDMGNILDRVPASLPAPEPYVMAGNREAYAYNIDGMRLIVPKDHAAQLDEVRALRLNVRSAQEMLAETKASARTGEMTEDQVGPWKKNDEAFKALLQHPLKLDALPEEILHAVRQIPNRSLITEVTVIPEVTPEQIKDGFTTRASINPLGQTTLYRPYRYDVESILKHEQVHRVQDKTAPFGKSLYAIAKSVDGDVEASAYAHKEQKSYKTRDTEGEAELESIGFLGRKLETFFEAAERSPARMALIARRAADTINNAEPEHRSIDQQEILARAKYIEKFVTPKVVEQLSERVLANPSSDDAKLLAELATRSDTKAEQALLGSLEHGRYDSQEIVSRAIARIGSQSTVQQLHDMLGRMTSGHNHVIDAMVELQPTAAAQGDLLASLATTESSYRGVANASFWLRHLEDSPAAFKLLPEIPGQPNATQLEKMRAALKKPEKNPYDDPDYEYNHDVESRLSDDRQIAAHLLGRHGDSSDIPTLTHWASDGDSQVAKYAMISLARLHSAKPSEQLDYLVAAAKPDSALRDAALERLAYGTHDSRLEWNADPRAEDLGRLAAFVKSPHAGGEESTLRALDKLPSEQRPFWQNELAKIAQRQEEFRDSVLARRARISPQQPEAIETQPPQEMPERAMRVPVEQAEIPMLKVGTETSFEATTMVPADSRIAQLYKQAHDSVVRVETLLTNPEGQLQGFQSTGFATLVNNNLRIVLPAHAAIDHGYRATGVTIIDKRGNLHTADLVGTSDVNDVATARLRHSAAERLFNPMEIADYTHSSSRPGNFAAFGFPEGRNRLFASPGNALVGTASFKARFAMKGEEGLCGSPICNLEDGKVVAVYRSAARETNNISEGTPAAHTSNSLRLMAADEPAVSIEPPTKSVSFYDIRDSQRALQNLERIFGKDFLREREPDFFHSRARQIELSTANGPAPLTLRAQYHPNRQTVVVEPIALGGVPLRGTEFWPNTNIPIYRSRLGIQIGNGPHDIRMRAFNDPSNMLQRALERPESDYLSALPPIKQVSI